MLIPLPSSFQKETKKTNFTRHVAYRTKYEIQYCRPAHEHDIEQLRENCKNDRHVAPDDAPDGIEY